MSVIEGQRVYHAPAYHEVALDGLMLLVDPETPSWIATDSRGAEIIRWIDGQCTVSEIVGRYQERFARDWSEAWLDVTALVGHALRADFLRDMPIPPSSYAGRGSFLRNPRLEELWIHLTNRCNLSCAHCLVSSSPSGIEGLGTDRWIDIVEQAKRLGAGQFYITGGEPFVRGDLIDVAREICRDADLVILTNAMLFRDGTLEALRSATGGRARLQVSIDGPEARIHDRIRGTSFTRTLEGVQAAIAAGYEPTVATVVTRSNVSAMARFPQFLARLGVRRHHLLWDHKQGRAAGGNGMGSPAPAEIIEMLEGYLDEAERHGVDLDNYLVARERVEGQRRVKIDLSMAGIGSACVYADGTVYPSAALAGVPELRMGSLEDDRLETIWRQSAVAHRMRQASVVDKQDCRDCYLRFICGGGDVEHSFFYSGSFLGADPFSPVHEWLLVRAIRHIVGERQSRIGRSGYDSPTVIAAMGESLSEMETIEKDGVEIATSRSTCVLSVDLDRSREKVRRFYAQAALEPQSSLCCPTAYDPEDLCLLPKEVIEVSYGCGSPIRFAGLAPGETYVDLGSGGGIDCFIGARRLGPSGRVIGVDMTPEMVDRAARNRPAMKAALGYDIVEFRSGYLEALPLDDTVADVVTSNCVVNLSPDKRRVLYEMWRILKNHGRAVISDTVSEAAIPRHMKANPRLWGECVSGALTEDEYFLFLEQVGFYGLSLLEKNLWKEVEGYRFYSVIIRGYKFGKNGTCDFAGQQAVYLGPLKAAIDEEGHLFPRNQAVEVCTDTAMKLSRPPYAGSFLVLDRNQRDDPSAMSCCTGEECC